ncbi:MAG: type II toxin-antitoxin system HicA family toxin [Bacteroidales bacterium]|nr:type II toxin-antitoxin system HicA family toxin [Bacteroidales bacterium]MCF8455392.1 type II toxin-antitoxin system HicA family toxin [Bacteroidales bacterium]
MLDRSRGSHQIWLYPILRKRTIVPMHKKDTCTGANKKRPAVKRAFLYYLFINLLFFAYQVESFGVFFT